MNLTELKSARQAGKDRMLQLAADTLKGESQLDSGYSRDVEDEMDLIQRSNHIISAEIEDLEKLVPKKRSGAKFIGIDLAKCRTDDMAAFRAMMSTLKFTKYKEKGQNDEEI